MMNPAPIPQELWDQVPPAAQVAILGLILNYEQQLRTLQARTGTAPGPAGPPPVPSGTKTNEAAVGAGALADLVGKTITHYTIGKMIATGNSGAVFRAKDTTKPGRAVAFQALRPELSGGDDDKERFAKVMMTVRGIKHPYLVRVYSAGKNGPYRWIAMKYIDGVSLSDKLRNTGVAGKLDWRTTYFIAVSLASGLAEIHKHNLLHRNLKPANIMYRNADRKTLIGDWSRARPLHGARVEPLPWPGQLVADLTYLSPEQTQPGTVEDVRCDIYGLGAILYTLLAGRPPFEAGTNDKMIEKIRGEDPVRPKEAQLAIPEAVEGMVLRMLSKRLDMRFQSANEVLKELERISKTHQLPFEPGESEED
jgi:eukaryotic-like serine/threonine-protein kinase